MKVHVHRLNGCSSTPLAHYLKALGILRLISEQEDPEVRGWWDKDSFVLATRLNRQKTDDFFLHRYKPTPLISPWNKGNGFHKSNKSFAKLQDSESQRFKEFREKIEVSRKYMDSISSLDIQDREKKNLILSYARKQWRGGCREWLDACVVLGSEEVKKRENTYPPLLGTGGNDGQFEFSKTFIEHIDEVFDLKSSEGKPKSKAMDWISASLWGATVDGNLKGKPIGQFLPGTAGGANNANGSDSISAVNPMDFILMLEGAVVFRSNVSRRMLSSEFPHAASPFTVNACEAGYDSASSSDVDAKREQWMPLWSHPSSYREVRQLFAEARARIATRDAQEPLDLAMAIKRLGTARGIEAFQRYVYIERNGKSKLAVPLGRFRVAEENTSNLTCIDDLDHWFKRLGKQVRKESTPTRFKNAEKSLADSLFAVTKSAKSASDPRYWQRVLIQLVNVEGLMRRGSRLDVGSIPGLSSRWVEVCKDKSPEFRLALAFALQRDPAPDKQADSVRRHWLPLDMEKSGNSTTGKNSSSFSSGGPEVVMNGRFGIDDAIALVERRLVEAQQCNRRHLPLQAAKGASANIADLTELLVGKVDIDRTLTLARGLMALDQREWRERPIEVEQPDLENWPEDAWMAIRLSTLPWPLRFSSGFELDIGTDPAIIRRLAAGDAATAVTMSLRRLRAVGLRSVVRAVSLPANKARLWAASLAFPVTKFTAARFLKRLDPNKG